MFYEKELRFLRGVFQKHHVRTLIMDKTEILSEIAASHSKEKFGIFCETVLCEAAYD